MIIVGILGMFIVGVVGMIIDEWIGMKVASVVGMIIDGNTCRIGMVCDWQSVRINGHARLVCVGLSVCVECAR